MLIVRLVLRRVRVRSHRYMPVVLLLVLRVVLRLLLVLRLLPVVILLRRAVDRLCSPGRHGVHPVAAAIDVGLEASRHLPMYDDATCVSTLMILVLCLMILLQMIYGAYV